MNNNQKKNSDKRNGFGKVENYIKISFFVALFIFGIAGTMVDSASHVPSIVLACCITWMFASITFYITLVGIIHENMDEIIEDYLSGEEEWAEAFREED